jgi:hypothetical protein
LRQRPRGGGGSPVDGGSRRGGAGGGGATGGAAEQTGEGSRDDTDNNGLAATVTDRIVPGPTVGRNETTWGGELFVRFEDEELGRGLSVLALEDGTRVDIDINIDPRTVAGGDPRQVSVRRRHLRRPDPVGAVDFSRGSAAEVPGGVRPGPRGGATMATSTTLDITGHRGLPVPNRLLRPRGPIEHLVVLLPGYGYTLDMPLFYYAENRALEVGADVLRVEVAYVRVAEFQAADDDEQRRWLLEDTEAALTPRSPSVPTAG